MAKTSPNFNTWSSSSDGNYCDKFKECSSLRDSIVSMDLDQPAWMQVEQAREQVNALHYPTQMDFPSPSLLGSVGLRHDSKQVQKFEDAHNKLSNDLFSRYLEMSPLDSSRITCRRLPNLTRSHAQEVFPEVDHLQVEAPLTRSHVEEFFPEVDHLQVEVPARMIKTGRRRRLSDGTPGGWVASKNLISERKRREKLQKGLITLRELVPMYTMKMDKVSILVDTIDYLQELKHTVEVLEAEDINGEEVCTDEKVVEVDKNSYNNLETSVLETEGDQRKKSSTNDSLCSEVFDEAGHCNNATSSSSQDWNSNEKDASYTATACSKIQLDVTKLDHGLYKFNLICTQQYGVLLQISQAMESLVIEIVHINIIVISSAKVTCTYIVKMRSSNDMTLEEVKANTIKTLGSFGLQVSKSVVKGNVQVH